MSGVRWAGRAGRYDVALGVVTLFALWCISAVLAGEPALIESGPGLPPAVFAVTPPVTAAPPTTPLFSPAGVAVVGGALADRGDMVAVGPPPTVPIPQPTPGDCESYRPLFAYHGATQAEADYFVPRILRRESGCGLDLLNDSTGDSGPCQVNPIHNRAGWFGGREYGDGGWLLALHGLRTRQALESPEWVGACLTLYRVCGSGAWSPPYSCANRRYPT